MSPNPTTKPPRVFVSYSHDSEDHKAWVRGLSERLRKDGIDAQLDQYHLALGDQLGEFITRNIAQCDFALLICTEPYVDKAEGGYGTAGYEVRLVVAAILKAMQDRVDSHLQAIAVLRQTCQPRRQPTFIGSCLWADLSADVANFEQTYELLLRKLHNVPKFEPPPLGSNPFTRVASAAAAASWQPDPEPETPSRFKAGEIALPVKGHSIKVLHDQNTAIVGGVDGRLVAIDLRTGKVLSTAEDEEIGRDLRPGGGENHYIANKYFFLELSPIEQCFYTMGHSAVLKVWSFNGGLRLDHSIPLLTPNFKKLRAAILMSHGKHSWSTWTCYSRPPPESVPDGIVDAKLSPDGSSLICLTEWFAIFRCDLAGRLRDDPVVVADAFSIEPANDDGSEIWVGRGSLENTLYRLSFHGFPGESRAVIVRGNFGSTGIFTLTDKLLYAAGPVLDMDTLTEARHSELSVWMGAAPLVLRGRNRALGSSGSMIRVCDLKSLKDDGRPLLAGHGGNVRNMDATQDEKHLVSISEGSLRVWDLERGRPVGSGDAAADVLQHGLQTYQPAFQTSKGQLVYAAQGRVCVMDLAKRSFSHLAYDGTLIGIASGKQDSQVCLLSLDSREGPPRPGLHGIISRLVKMEPPRQYFVRQVSCNRLTEQTVRDLPNNSPPNIYWGPNAGNSKAIDMGSGRVAMLLAGHLAIYDVNSKSLPFGPIDVSTPPGAASNGEWYLYAQLAVSLQGQRIFVRGRRRRVKVFNAFNLHEMGEIPGTESQCGLMVPWRDPKYLLLSARVKVGYGSRDILLLVDTEAAALIGKVCDLHSSGSENLNSALLLGGGTALAFLIGGQVHLLDLTRGEVEETPLATHADSIVSIHACPVPDWIATVSIDGTARFWDVRRRIPAMPSGFARPVTTPLGDAVFDSSW